MARNEIGISDPSSILSMYMQPPNQQQQHMQQQTMINGPIGSTPSSTTSGGGGTVYTLSGMSSGNQQGILLHHTGIPVQHMSPFHHSKTMIQQSQQAPLQQQQQIIHVQRPATPIILSVSAKCVRLSWNISNEFTNVIVRNFVLFFF